MPFLTLNGVEVPVAAGSDSTLQLKRFGSAGRSYAGAQRHSYRAYKREWKLRTPPLAAAEAEALRGLIEGQGAHWRFDTTSHYDSDHGLTCPPPADTSAATVKQETAALSYLELSGYSGQLLYQLPKSSRWTLLARNALTASLWQNRMFRSDDTLWADGVRNATMNPGRQGYEPETGRLVLMSVAYGGMSWAPAQARTLASRCESVGYVYKCTRAGTTGSMPPAWPATYGATCTDGSVIWQNMGLALARWAMLTWLPYPVPDTWAAQLHGAMSAYGKTFASLPNLIARGELMGGAPVLVAGETGESEFVEFNLRGVRQPGQAFDFTLREV